MALTITVSGTPEEVLAFNRTLEQVIAAQKESVREWQNKTDKDYINILVTHGKIPAIKAYRESMPPYDRNLRVAKDYIDALIERALSADVIRRSADGYTFLCGKNFNR
jgi:ribosomal protein L7/L12